MNRLALLCLTITLVGLLAPAGALAKGASEATITGPGLGDGLTLPGEGQPGGEQLMQIADHAGFFAALSGTHVTRPAGDLGPRYVIEYTMSWPGGQADVIRQELYPYARLDSYAESAPVTYVEPGQRFFGTGETGGGWWIANPSLKDDLVVAGLPASAPSRGGSLDTGPWGLVTLGVLAVAVAAAGIVVVFSRRRSSPATSSPASG